MRYTKRIIAIIVSASGALMMAAATTAPTAVDSNIAAWLKLFGVHNPPPAFATSHADQWTFWLGLAVLLVGLVGVWEWFFVKPKSIPPIAHPNSPYRKRATDIAAEEIARAIGLARLMNPPGIGSVGSSASLQMKVTRAPAFDVSLTEAALYAVTGNWGMIGGKEHFATNKERVAVGNQVADWLSEFEQKASNGDVRVWGRPQENSSGPIVEIDALHWRTHEAFPISVALGEPQSRQRLSLSREGGYDDLRVNRAEFEEQWPRD